METPEKKTKKRKASTPSQKTPKAKTAKSDSPSTSLIPTKCYIPKKYRKPLKGKGKFNTPTHIEMLLPDFCNHEEQLKRMQNQVLFPRWTVNEQDIRWIGENDIDAYLPGNEKGKLLHFVSKQMPNPDDPISIARFHSLCYTAQSGLPLGISETYLNNSDNVVDIIMNVGGPVWAMDWCPSLLTMEQQNVQKTKSFIAISTNKHAENLHAVGKRYEGKNVIQIWDLGILTPEGMIKDQSSHFQPYMALGIVHNKSSAWHLSWCPRGATYNDNEEIPRLGLLAVCFGDGTTSIYSVPHPDYLKKQKNLVENVPIFIDLKPVFSVDLGPQAVISTIQWSVLGNCDMLAAGSSDGKIAIWAINDNEANEIVPSIMSGTSSEGLRADNNNHLSNQNINQIPILYFKAHDSSIQRLCWSPNNPNLIASCAMSSSIKVWDLRSCVSPIDIQQTQGGITNGMCWDSYHEMLPICLDDGGIRLISSFVTKKFEYHKSFVWDIESTSLLRFLASCDANGQVILMPLVVGIEESRANRKLKDQESVIDIVDIEMRNGEEHIKLYARNECCIEDTSEQKQDTKNANEGEAGEPQIFPDPKKAWHRIKWSPNVFSSNWLAYGGCAGIVRVQVLRWLDPTQ